MSQKTSKLLRKIAHLAGKTDTYIKSQYKQMDKTMQRAYLAYMRENLLRVAKGYTPTKPQKETVVLDHKLPEK